MKKNMERSVWVWIIVIIVNILALYFFNESSFILLIVVFATVIPVLLSHSKLKYKNKIGYGLPILFFIPIPFFIYTLSQCSSGSESDSLCGFFEIFYFSMVGFPALVFMIFYKIGLYFSK